MMVFQTDDRPKEEKLDHFSDIVLDVSSTDTSVIAQESREEGKSDIIHSEQLQENDDTGSFVLTTISQGTIEATSDEGWQEANSKGRSGKIGGRRNGQKKPALAKLKINGPELSEFIDASYKRRTISPVRKTISKSTSPNSSAPPKFPKALSTNVAENQTKLQAINPVSKTSPPATLTAMASKSLSYKEVAVAPPGTILKPPVLDKQEVNNEIPATLVHDSQPDISEEESEKTVVEVAKAEEEELTGTSQSETEVEKAASEHKENLEKAIESNGSKLSAAAQPFNPRPLSLISSFNSVAVTGVYDVRPNQSMVSSPPMGIPPPSVASRVPFGPRSPLYFRTGGNNFHMKHGFLNYQNHSPPKVMNPHAPEFVPGKAWQPILETGNLEASTDSFQLSGSSIDKNEDLSFVGNKLDDQGSVAGTKDKVGSNSNRTQKSELARQILVSFIVKSVHNNLDTSNKTSVHEANTEVSGHSSDPIERDSAIIKVVYGNENRRELTPHGTDHDQSKITDLNKNNNGDGEGYTVVTKRRRKRQQFASAVNGLYTQQSICASVR
ncbi:hypothetical protein BVC80_455g11 [Macleaya cordata]|uniref:Uncharacterized protein n=1 Tax=Macleaya cordata TaxID=56857 RepID=A0A200Q0K4_MACCD|nr:hypothetical protein BVC80_455g11 [Macleaya cordata]